MTLEQLERKFTEHYRNKMREYAKVEGLHSDYGGTENTKRMHILWGECVALKSIIEMIKAIRLDNELPLEGPQ